MSKESPFSKFQYSRTERRGILALVVLCLLSAAYCYTMPGMVHRRQLARFEEQVLSGPVEPVVGSRQADTGIAYRDPAGESTGGTVSAGNGSERVYRHSSALKPDMKEAPEAERPVRINSASAGEILRSVTLPPAIAYRIVRFREGAGGFHSILQLRDVYELTDSLYRRISGDFILDTVVLKRINVNTATEEELMGHPYISKGLAAQMVNFREKVSPYRSTADLLRLYFMDEELLDKLMPYISY